MLGLYDFTMPGGIKLNHGNLISQGQAEVKEVEEEIKSLMQLLVSLKDNI
jgi:hypothetical protein